MHIRSGEAGGPEEPHAPLHRPWEGQKQGKTFRFHVPGFKVTSSLACHGQLGTAWCSDWSNSCCKVISSGRTCVLRVTLSILAAATRPAASAGHEGQRAARAAGRRQRRGCRIAWTRWHRHPLRPSCTKPVKSATWCSGKCFSFFPILKKYLVAFIHRLTCG